MNRRIIEGAFARLSAGTGNFFDDVLAPDFAWTIEGSGPSADVFRGREIFLARAVRPFAWRLSTPVPPTAGRSRRSARERTRCTGNLTFVRFR